MKQTESISIKSKKVIIKKEIPPEYHGAVVKISENPM